MNLDARAIVSRFIKSRFALVLAGYAFQLVLGVLGSAVAFRALSPDGVGIVLGSSATAVFVYGPLIASIGKSYLVARAELGRTQLANYFFAAGTIGLTLGAAMCALSAFLFPNASLFVVAAIIATAPLSANVVLVTELEARGDFLVVTLARACVAVVTFAARLIAAHHGSLEMFALSVALEQAALLAICGLAASLGKEQRATFGGMGQALSGAARYAPTEYLAGLPARVPMAAFGFLGMHQEAGLYSAASRIPDFISATLLVAYNVKRPQVFAVAYGEVGVARDRAIRNLMAPVILLACLCSAASVASAATIISFLFGREFADAAPAATIYSWIPLIISLGLVQEPLLMASKQFRISFLKSLVAALFALAVVPLAAKLEGISAVVLVVLFALAFQSIVSNLLWKETRQIAKLQASMLLPSSLLRALQ